MKKALPNTKVTVKLRRSRYKEEWYLIIESYPVYKRGSNRASRVVESINRTISTPIWDKSSIARILPDGSFNYKPKRDLNGIIQCRSTIDQEACIYADNVRKLSQHEYDSVILYTDKENELAAQNERSEQDFIKYFNGIISKRHPNSSNSIIVNWMRVGELLKIYSQGNPIPFKSISVKLLEDIKMFLLRAPMGGNKKYNPQIQIFAEFETKRPFFESSFKTKRPKKDLHATRTTKPEIRAKITLFRAWALSSTIQQAI